MSKVDESNRQTTGVGTLRGPDTRGGNAEQSPGEQSPELNREGIVGSKGMGDIQEENASKSRQPSMTAVNLNNQGSSHQLNSSSGVEAISGMPNNVPLTAEHNSLTNQSEKPPDVQNLTGYSGHMKNVKPMGVTGQTSLAQGRQYAETIDEQMTAEN